MTDPNERELQSALRKEFGSLGEQDRVLQIQVTGLDIVARSRWPMLRKSSKNLAQGLTVPVETRFVGGKLATNERIADWVKQVAHDHWILAWSESIRQQLRWPNGWPVPSDNDLREAYRAVTLYEAKYAQHYEVGDDGRITDA